MRILYGTHIRPRDIGGRPLSTGGVSLVVLEWEDGSCSAGVSRCSERDTFIKAKGHRLAQDRAILAKAEGKRISVPAFNGKQDDTTLVGIAAQMLPAAVLGRMLA